jgi:hypothetical protein
MRSHSVRLTPQNLPLCARLWGGRETYARDELPRVLAAAAMLLSEGRALGAIVFEDKHARAFGITTFVDERFVDAYLAQPHPHLGKRLLLEADKPGCSDILDVHQIGLRNAGAGLQLVVANTCYDTSAHEPDTVLGRLIGAFQEVHRGYRVARIVNEVFGEAGISVVEDSRTYEVVRIFDLQVPGRKLQSLVGTLTREQAAALKNPLLTMFAYSPPRLFFTATEQRLLSEALAGITDERLSERLGIPVSAVKARWSRIQERVARMAPELFEHVPATPNRGGRGVQTRHLIVQYVRDHPSELTPYAAPHAAAGSGRVAVRRSR